MDPAGALFTAASAADKNCPKDSCDFMNLMDFINLIDFIDSSGWKFYKIVYICVVVRA